MIYQSQRMEIGSLGTEVLPVGVRVTGSASQGVKPLLGHLPEVIIVCLWAVGAPSPADKWVPAHGHVFQVVDAWFPLIADNSLWQFSFLGKLWDF